MNTDRAGRPETERQEGGFTTAEFAIALPAVILVLLLGAALLGLLVDQIRCVDAARAAARSLARGDDRAVAVRLALDTAPDGSTVEVGSGRRVNVKVIGPTRVPVLAGSFRAEAEAEAPNEAFGVNGRRLRGAAVGPAPVSLPPHLSGQVNG